MKQKTKTKNNKKQGHSRDVAKGGTGDVTLRSSDVTSKSKSMLPDVIMDPSEMMLSRPDVSADFSLLSRRTLVLTAAFR